MAKNLPNKVGAWLTDAMLEHIDSKRDYRTRSEYLRMLVERDMAGKAAPKGAKVDAPKEPQWEHVRDVVTAQLTSEGHDVAEMLGPQIEYMSEKGFWLDYMRGANCIERMEKHEAQKPRTRRG